MKDDAYPSLGTANYALALLFIAYIFSFIDRQILTLLVGPIREDFGITDFEFSLLQGTAFAIMYTLVGLPMGRLADKHSRRLIVSASVAFWSLMTAAGGLTQSFNQMFAARMGIGAGEAGLAPAAYSLISDSYRREHVGMAMSVYKSAVKIGAGLALVIGGFLFDYFDSLGTISLPVIGVLKPWQATLITVGAPGLLVAALLLTINEPSRKGMMTAQGDAHSPSVREVGAYIWARKRLYLSLCFGSSLMAMGQYGSGAWYPEFFVRNYGYSKSEAGSAFGLIVITAGTLGVVMGAVIAGWLERRGHTDSYVRAILITSLIAVPLTVAAPLMGSDIGTLLMLWPATLFVGSYLGVMAVSFVVVTPNQLRGQVTAFYIFVTNILGMALGTSVLAAFTDFLYQDDNALHYSIATANALFYPAAGLLFWICLPAYRRAVEEAKS